MKVITFILLLAIITFSYFSGKTDGKFDGYKEICQEKKVVEDYTTGNIICFEEENEEVKTTEEGFNFMVIK